MDPGWDRTVTLTVGYSWTTLENAEPFLLKMLDEETKYPTPIAQALERHIPVTDELGNPIEWDGWIHLLRQPKTKPPSLPTGLLDLVQRICAKYGFPTLTKDERERPAPGVPDVGPFQLRDYQKAAVAAALKTGHGILEMPPRSGKTRTMMEIHRQLSLPTIWLVPTDRIAKQTQRVAEELFGKHYSLHQVGSDGWEEAAAKQLVITTAATAARLPPKFWTSRLVLVVDEWHHAAARTYRNVVLKDCGHIFHRFGMTGTNFRSGDDELAMHALLSNVLYKVTSTDLAKAGFLVPTDVLFVPVKAGRIRVPGSDQSFISGHGKYGIHEHKYRNQLVAHTAAVLAKEGKKVLVLVGTKEQGYQVLSVLKGLLPDKADGAQFDKAEFVSTDSTRKNIDKILDSFNTLADEILVLVGTSLVGEGVDLPVADALVYAKGESAEVGLLQAAYRVCTAIHGKPRATLVDFADRHSAKLMRHSHERLRAYYQEPLFKVQVLDGMADFIAYLKRIATKPEAA